MTPSNTATLNVSLSHSNFGRMAYTASMRLDDFMLLNNENRTDLMAYGNLRLSGELNVTGRLRLRGDLSDPEPYGRFEIREGGKVFLQTREFVVERGALVYQGTLEPEIDVRAIRARTRLSQDDFATAFGFTINQIKDWEQGRARPLGGVRAYLLIIERDAKSVLGLLRKARGKKAA